MTALLEAGRALVSLPSELEEANESVHKENEKIKQTKRNNNTKNQQKRKKEKHNKEKPEQLYFSFSCSRPLGVSQLPRVHLKENKLNRHANLLANIFSRNTANPWT